VENVALDLERSNSPGDETVTIFNIDNFWPGFRFPAAAQADGMLGKHATCNSAAASGR